jgi:hypothetical protein
MGNVGVLDGREQRLVPVEPAKPPARITVSPL